MFDSATEVCPHEHVLLIAVLSHSLDEATMTKLSVDVMTAAGKRPQVPVVLDVSRVRFAPSVALGLLVQLSRGLKLEGRRLALVGVQPRLLATIRVTRLDSQMEIYDNVNQVVGSS
ncbi:MAG TPA: STAS domain-containing protein [Phycisphaerae bacterium]|nr:STAS domain-containing protein [Phycisphaerae bacterium]HRY68212.1 STAS domain-containing protein [Phycisphaerae bacterium]HSA28605.1 STAS domain-containing protein [Phycisphaerae bacterium]